MPGRDDTAKQASRVFRQLNVPAMSRSTCAGMATTKIRRVAAAPIVHWQVRPGDRTPLAELPVDRRQIRGAPTARRRSGPRFHARSAARPSCTGFLSLVVGNGVPARAIALDVTQRYSVRALRED